jgi:hypothetical protein
VLRWAATLASRAAVHKAAKAKAEKDRLALLPNPIRDWKCNGCSRMNAFVEGQFKAKAKKKQKKRAPKKKGDDDDDDSEGSEGSGKEGAAAAAAEEEAPPEPIARCHSCGAAHTYVPRGRRGVAVLSHNALAAAFDALQGDGWAHKGGWLSAAKLSQWHGITADDRDDQGSGAVLKIELIQNNLAGPLPPSVCKLQAVTHLLLDQNGERPSAFVFFLLF